MGLNKPLAAALLTLGLSLSGCGEDKPKQPGVGDIQSVSGQTGSAQIKLGRVIDPIPDSDLSQAAQGRRLAAVELKVANNGNKALKFVPVSDVKLKTSLGDAPATIAQGTPCPENVQVKVMIPAGEIKVVCAIFQPKSSAQLTGVTVALPGAPVGTETEWKLQQKPAN